MDPPRGHDAVLIGFLAASSALACIVVIAMSTAYPVLRQPPGRFVRSRSAFTLIYSVVFCVYAGWATDAADHEASADEGAGGCVPLDSLDILDLALGAARFCEVGIVAWQLVVALDVLVIVRDPFRPGRHTKKLVLLVWMLCLLQVLTTLALFGSGNLSQDWQVRSQEEECGGKYAALWYPWLMTVDIVVLGLIDILETWRARWHVQNLVLRFFFRYVVCMQWYNPEGITAIPPDEYAARFQEFARDQLLRLPGEAVGAKSWQPWW